MRGRLFHRLGQNIELSWAMALMMGRHGFSFPLCICLFGSVAASSRCVLISFRHAWRVKFGGPAPRTLPFHFRPSQRPFVFPAFIMRVVSGTGNVVGPPVCDDPIGWTTPGSSTILKFPCMCRGLSSVEDNLACSADFASRAEKRRHYPGVLDSPCDGWRSFPPAAQARSSISAIRVASTQTIFSIS